MRKEHGESGHVNIYVRDQESVITAFGEHHRVIAFLPDSAGLYCRVDHKHGKRQPHNHEILTVARKDQGIHGVWKLHRKEMHGNGKSTDYFFIRI